MPYRNVYATALYEIPDILEDEIAKTNRYHKTAVLDPLSKENDP